MATVKLFRPRKAPSRKEILRCKPRRNERIDFETQADGTVVLRIPMHLRGGIYKVFGKMKDIHATKDVELEEIGSLVWSLCDGKHNCETIAARLTDTYRLSKVEAQVSLLAFLEMLGKRGYIILAKE